MRCLPVWSWTGWTPRCTQPSVGTNVRSQTWGVVHAALTSADVPFLVVKGPAVTRWYADPSLRSYVDLDVVVAPHDLGGALDALEDAGFALLDANWPFLLTADVHELVLRTPSGGALDLHWSLGPVADAHRPLAAPSGLCGRSVEFEAGPVVVHGLGDADALVHLAVHAAASGGHRLVWLTDLRAALAATAPDAALRETAQPNGARSRHSTSCSGECASRGTRDRASTSGVRGTRGRSWTGAPPGRRRRSGRATGASLSRMVARSSRETATTSVVRSRRSRSLGPPLPSRGVEGRR